MLLKLGILNRKNENLKKNYTIAFYSQSSSDRIFPKLKKLNYSRSPHRSQADRDAGGCLVVANIIAIILILLTKGCS